MLNKNIETFLGCDSGYEDAGRGAVRRPVRFHHLLPARYALWQCRHSPGILWTGKLTARTRIRDLAGLPYFR